MVAGRLPWPFVTAERDPYAVLSIPASATPEQVAAAYRRLARRHHPDVSSDPGAEQRMAEINAAWTLLRDASRRAGWDRAHGIEARVPRTPAPPATGTASSGGGAGGSRPGPASSPAGQGTQWSAAGSRAASTGWRRGPGGEGAAGPPPGNPRGSVLPFGRHIGWSLGEIARVDPGYLVWLEGRREGESYRAEIAVLLEPLRARTGEPAVPRRRRGRFG